VDLPHHSGNSLVEVIMDSEKTESPDIEKAEKRAFKVEILDKYSKKFLWMESYYFSVKFLDRGMSPQFKDTEVSRATWSAFKIGDIADLYMFKADNGLWYPT
jgi:hypothetical protein